ncbi:MAG TPA: Ig-like domain-containing protein [Balneolaceae bacterium]|nr:Ig-like domain-containing protein [Balneolaceae bacterium]
MKVGDVDEFSPVLVSGGSYSYSVAEQTTQVTTLQATDKDAADTLSYSLIGSADDGFFQVDKKTGALSFKSAPSYASPQDGNKDNTYELTVQVSDGDHKISKQIKVMVQAGLPAPTAFKVAPDSNATGISTDSVLAVSFNQLVTKQDFSGITISEGTNNVTNVSASLSDSTLYIDHDKFAKGEIYTVTIPPGVVANDDGVSNKAVSWSFTAIKAAPVAAAVRPDSGSAGIAIDSSLSITFDQPVSIEKLTAVSISDGSETISYDEPTLSDSTISIPHSRQAFKENTAYTVSVNAGMVQNTDGVPNAAFSWKFTTVESVPVAVRVAPDSNATGITVDSTPAVTFDQSVSKVDLSKITVKDSDDNPVNNISASLIDSTIRINHDDFAKGNVYMVDIPSGVVSNRDGVGNEAVSWKFTTIKAPPLAIDVAPDSNATNIAVDSLLALTFDQAVTEQDFSGITISDESNDVAHVLASLNNSTIRIDHDRFTKGNTYRVTIPSGAVVNSDDVPNKVVSWSFTATKAAPVAADVRPDSGSAGIAVDSSLAITFDQPVNLTDLNGITISDGKNTISYDEPSLTDSTVTIQHADFKKNITYTVTVAKGQVSNSDGAPNAQFNWSFTTIKTAPMVSQRAPEDGAVGVAVDSALSITFNQLVKQVDLSEITISDGNTEVGHTVAHLADSTITIRHDELDNNQRYTVTIPAGAVENSDGVLNKTIVWSFRSIKSKPLADRIEPGDGATAVGIDSVLALHFDQAVKELDLTGISIIGPDEQLAGHVSATLKDSMLLITHDTFEHDKEYKVTVPAGVVANADNVANPKITWSFRTIQAAPIAIKRFPTGGSSGIAIDSTIGVIFDQPVSEDDLSGVSLTDSNGQPVSGVKASLEDSTIRIRHADLAYENEYTITIPAGAVENSDGVGNAKISWSFTSIQAAPVASQIHPADRSTGIALDSVLSVRFDQPVSKIDLSGISISAEGEPVGKVTASLEDSTLEINHQRFVYGVTYQVSIPARAVQNSDGVGNAEIRWSFTALKAAPLAVAVRPDSGSVGIAVDTSLAITFNQPVNLTDLNGITISDGKNTISYDEPSLTDSTVIIQHADFKKNITYTVTVAKGLVSNSDGVPNRHFTWSFTSIKGAPQITAETPEQGSQGVGIDTTITVTFDQSVSIETLDGIHILTGDTQVNDVSAVLNGKTLNISHAPFDYLTTYTVIIPANTVVNTDQVGNAEIRWSFTTIIEKPGPVTLFTPPDGNTFVPTDTVFTWSSVDRAASFDYQLSSSDQFADPVDEQSGLKDTSYASNSVMQPMTRYYWRVRAVNVGGKGDWSAAFGFTTKAEAPKLLFPAQNQKKISTAPLMQWQGDSDLRYQFALATDTSFQQVDTSQVVQNNHIQLQGLSADTKYYWRVRVKTDSGRSDWSEIRVFRTRPAPKEVEQEPVTVNLDFGNTSKKEQNTAPQQKDYRMVGLPGTDYVRLDEFFTGPYKKTWRAFIETGDDQNYYDEYSKDDDRFVFKPGLGFWVLSTDIVTDNRTYTAVTPDEHDTYGIPVHPGWNIIANPFEAPVEWQLVRDYNNIKENLYGYDQSFIAVDTLKPFAGYYYYNDPSLHKDSLYIPYTGFNQRGIEKPKKANSSLANLDYVNLGVQFDDSAKAPVDVQIVYSPKTKKHEKVSKRLQPDLDFAQIGMTITDDPSVRLRYNRIPGKDIYKKEKYYLEFKAPVGSEVTWHPNVHNLPKSTAMLLVNRTTHQSFLMSKGEHKKFKTTEPVSRYDLYVGKNGDMKALQSSLLPKKFTLAQNYPNPFNPTTIIRYSVPKRTKVRLEVFDLLGRKVETLVHTRQKAGWHTVNWDASHLASGVYMYRLQAGDKVFVKKMTLVK